MGNAIKTPYYGGSNRICDNQYVNFDTYGINTSRDCRNEFSRPTRARDQDRSRGYRNPKCKERKMAERMMLKQKKQA